MDRLGLWPDQDDIVVHASVTVEDVMDPKTVIDSSKLHQLWPQMVMATHVDWGNPSIKVNPSIFTPPDLDRFLAVRCRAVSASERHGPNINGDAFPREDLVKSHETLIGKGFYIEHASHDPRNAVGIIAHSQWLKDQDYVIAVALVDKSRFPSESNMIRSGLAHRNAGVSIGCVAGVAQCSVCGHLARKRFEICAHMDRSNPFCVKGKRQANGDLAHDICRELTFYELSYTKAPADRDALPHLVLGAEQGQDKKEDAPANPADIKIPDESETQRLVHKEMEQTVKSLIHKMIKGEIDRRLPVELKSMQQKLRPVIRDAVRKYQQGLTI